MIRKAKRFFKYSFPFAIICVSIFSFLYGKKNEHSALPQQENIESTKEENLKTGTADQLKLNSYNPNDNTTLSILALKAKQNEKSIDLINPKSKFEKDGNVSTLEATKADYVESEGIINFFDEVGFIHSSGLTAKAPQALLVTDKKEISGTNGVDASHKQSTITGNSYLIKTKEGVISVKGKATLTISKQ